MVRRCTYPSIHFFVSRSRSVARRVRVQAFVCVGVCRGGDVCVQCGVWYVWCVICVVCDMCGVCVSCRVLCRVLYRVSCRVSCVCCAFLLVLHRNRSRVYVQNGRFERTHENVFNVHTGASLSSLLASLSSRVSLSLLLVSLSFFLFSLSNNDNDHSSSRLQYQGAWTLAHSCRDDGVPVLHAEPICTRLRKLHVVLQELEQDDDEVVTPRPETHHCGHEQKTKAQIRAKETTERECLFVKKKNGVCNVKKKCLAREFIPITVSIYSKKFENRIKLRILQL